MTTKRTKGAKVKANTLATRSLVRKRADEVKAGFLAKGSHIPNVTLHLYRSGDDSVKK